MQMRINGLRAECALLDAEISVRETGQRHEYGYLDSAHRKRADITDVFVSHLRDVRGTKQTFISVLEARLAQGT